MPHKKKSRRYLAPLVLFTLAGWALWALGRNEPTAAEGPDAEPSGPLDRAGSTLPPRARTRPGASAGSPPASRSPRSSAAPPSRRAPATSWPTRLKARRRPKSPPPRRLRRGAATGEEGEEPPAGEVPPAEGEGAARRGRRPARRGRSTRRGRRPPAEGEDPPSEGEDPGDGDEGVPGDGRLRLRFPTIRVTTTLRRLRRGPPREPAGSDDRP